MTWTNGITTEIASSGGAHVADSAGVTISAGTTTVTATMGTSNVTALTTLSLAEPAAAGGTKKLLLLGVGER